VALSIWGLVIPFTMYVRPYVHLISLKTLTWGGNDHLSNLFSLRRWTVTYIMNLLTWPRQENQQARCLGQNVVRNLLFGNTDTQIWTTEDCTKVECSLRVPRDNFYGYWHFDFGMSQIKVTRFHKAYALPQRKAAHPVWTNPRLMDPSQWSGKTVNHSAV